MNYLKIRNLQMLKILYIAEGEIEERFINFLSQNNFIQSGRCLKFNLMQNYLKDNSNILRLRKDKIYCILDTDVLLADNITKLICNLKKLRNACGNNVCLLIQNKNFEDELKFILNCSNLGKFFHLPYNTTKDLKEYLAQDVDYQKIISKENLSRYCNRYEFFQEVLKNQGQLSTRVKIISIKNCMII